MSVTTVRRDQHPGPPPAPRQRLRPGPDQTQTETETEVPSTAAEILEAAPNIHSLIRGAAPAIGGGADIAIMHSWRDAP